MAAPASLRNRPFAWTDFVTDAPRIALGYTAAAAETASVLLLAAAFFSWLRARTPRLPTHRTSTDMGTSCWHFAPLVNRIRDPVSQMSKESVFAKIGGAVGALTGVVTFIAVYFAAIESVGWVFGIALGWIPAGLAALLAYLLGRYLWWLAAMLVLAIIVAASNA